MSRETNNQDISFYTPWSSEPISIPRKPQAHSDRDAWSQAAIRRESEAAERLKLPVDQEIIITDMGRVVVKSLNEFTPELEQK